MTDFTPCPKTIRLCIETLPARMGMVSALIGDYHAYDGDCRAALEALLPDPAEELVREWGIVGDYDEGSDVADFARWLINQGKVRP